jgi:hypothetical protein
MSNYKIAGLALVGVAALALVAGTVTGILVFDKKDEIESQCGLAGDAAACTPDGKAAADAAQALAVTSTVSFVTAIASGGLAVMIFLIDTADDVAAPEQAQRVAFGGRW